MEDMGYELKAWFAIARERTWCIAAIGVSWTDFAKRTLVNILTDVAVFVKFVTAWTNTLETSWCVDAGSH